MLTDFLLALIVTMTVISTVILFFYSIRILVSWLFQKYELYFLFKDIVIKINHD